MTSFLGETKPGLRQRAAWTSCSCEPGWNHLGLLCPLLRRGDHCTDLTNPGYYTYLLDFIFPPNEFLQMMMKLKNIKKSTGNQDLSICSSERLTMTVLLIKTVNRDGWCGSASSWCRRMKLKYHRYVTRWCPCVQSLHRSHCMYVLDQSWVSLRSIKWRLTLLIERVESIWFVLWLFSLLTWRRWVFWPILQPVTRGRLRWFGFTFEEPSCRPSLVEVCLYFCGAKCNVHNLDFAFSHF